MSELKILSPTGLSRRLSCGRQGLAEPLGGDDDELVAALRAQERVDPGGQVQLAGGQVVGDLNVVGIHRPGPHAPAYDRPTASSTRRPGFRRAVSLTSLGTRG